MVSAERVFTRNVFRGVLVYTALIGIAWCWLFPIAWAVSAQHPMSMHHVSHPCYYISVIV